MQPEVGIELNLKWYFVTETITKTNMDLEDTSCGRAVYFLCKTSKQNCHG